MSAKVKILYIINDSHPLKYFLKNHIYYLNSLESYDISVILNNNKNEKFEDFNIKVFHFDIKRTPDFWSDFIILIKLVFHLVSNRYDIIHSITPKSGLISAISSFITFSPVRIHTFTGQVWANYYGIKRKLFKFLDWLIISLNTHALADSNSQKVFLMANHIGTNSNIIVLNKGSICGVNLDKFNLSRAKCEEINIRKSLNLQVSDFVILYVGRLNIDKGIFDLIEAFLKFPKSEIHLIILGKDESNIVELTKSKYNHQNINNVHFINETLSPEFYMAISNILCLPSYREGFGNVVIEAAAMGVPAVVSRIYGLQDSIIENKTGIFFEPGNINELFLKLDNLYKNRDTLRVMSEECKIFVENNFDSKILSSCLVEFYNKVLKK